MIPYFVATRESSLRMCEDIKKVIEQVTGKTVEISVVLAGKGQQVSYDAYPDLTKIKQKVLIEYVD